MQVTNYISFFSNIKIKIREAQVKATLSANAQMIQMYWDIGNMISEKQKIEGWGANVISKLSSDLKKEMPELRGFSERNIGSMLRFAKEYSKVQQPVAQLQSTEIQNDIKVQLPTAQLNDIKLLLSITWTHNIILIEKILDTNHEILCSVFYFQIITIESFI